MTQAGGRAFDWLIPDQLAACVDPVAGQQAAEELRSGNVTLLVNLYERPDPPELLDALGAETLHLPVHNSDAPSQAQLDRGVQAITEALRQGKKVAVHCGAGLGRSGTLLAAFLVSEGSDADEAIARVRAARPGSVETLEQENAVREYQRRVRSQRGAT
jgi:atypical dual specificity phosphatase